MDDQPTKVTPELLAHAMEQDESACDRLVEMLYPLIASRVGYQIRHASDHEDIIQEVFVKIFLKLEQYRGDKPFEHWVSRIAVTTCYDWLRKLKARPLLSYADLDEAEAEAVERTLSGNLEGDREHQRELVSGLLDKLIAQLNAREQIVIRLLDLQEHSVKEITEITGWSASKIKSLAMRARRKLAAHLQRLENSSS